jgi:hypothetical protein
MTDEVAELQGEELPETTGEGVELEESPPSLEEASDVEDKPKAKGVQKRIDELTSNWRTAERDRDYWRELAVKAQQAPEKTVEPVSVPTPGKPTLEAYESYDAYVEALADWKYEQRAQAERARQEQEQRQQTEQERVRSFQQRAQSVRESHPDFDDVVSNPALPISQAMADAAYSSEKGPEILYHLGTNPQLAEQLYRMSPVEAAMAIGRLEATLSRPARNKTNAPDPIEPVSGGSGTPTVDPDRMTPEQWLAWRNKQLQR